MLFSLFCRVQIVFLNFMMVIGRLAWSYIVCFVFGKNETASLSPLFTFGVASHGYCLRRDMRKPSVDTFGGTLNFLQI